VASLDTDEGTTEGSRSSEFGLSSVMGRPYHDIYLPLMKTYDLVVTYLSNRSGKMVDAPSIVSGHGNKSGYIWDSFFIEFQLTLMEISYFCINGCRKYYVRIGKFSEGSFTVVDQLKRNRTITHLQCCSCEHQLDLVRGLTSVLPEIMLSQSASNAMRNSSAIDREDNGDDAYSLDSSQTDEMNISQSSISDDLCSIVDSNFKQIVPLL
jgi:hypothetical protein